MSLNRINKRIHNIKIYKKRKTEPKNKQLNGKCLRKKSLFLEHTRTMKFQNTWKWKSKSHGKPLQVQVLYPFTTHFFLSCWHNSPQPHIWHENQNRWSQKEVISKNQPKFLNIEISETTYKNSEEKLKSNPKKICFSPKKNLGIWICFDFYCRAADQKLDHMFLTRFLFLKLEEIFFSFFVWENFQNQFSL